MGTRSWKTVLAGVSALAALAAVLLVVAAALGDVGWYAVIGTAAVAVLGAALALLADSAGGREGPRFAGRHQ